MSPKSVIFAHHTIIPTNKQHTILIIKRIFSLSVFLLTAAFATAQQPELYKDWHQTPEARADDIIRRLTI